MENFEKLGAFYLGRVYDMASKKTRDELLLYDSKDLVTHAVCVGMTGSGKTGLCISLIEEAAIDGVPSILIDPKGDLSNLLLTFPDLAPQDFLPWINLDDARQKSLTPEEYAAKQAETWKNGLESWGQDGARIQRFRDSTEMLVFTPGSNAGLPISILKSFAAPPEAIASDGDLFQECIKTTVTSLLGLVGIKADPVQSREHILLSTILHDAWRQGQDLDLPMLIQSVQNPSITKVGVLDLESFYPSKDRFELVLALNNLLASPGFTTWLEGMPLDIGKILYTPTGKPRIAIFSIAHLGDAERMFFVSLLMNQVLGWTRSQSGTTSLRAIVYMDEIFGFLPPIENPPSKQPMLSMLKQARAFGVGMVLATQNPVDLDYKALGNAGTWLIGRLQTERDKARLLDGLDSAATSSGLKFSRSTVEKIISSLGNRVFLMNNTHEDAPVIFHTRWALSYLRGPLTRDQIKILMDPLKTSGALPLDTSSAKQVPVEKISQSGTTLQAVPLTPDIPAYFLPVRGKVPSGNKLVYQPRILGAAKINYSDTKKKVDLTEAGVYITPVTDDAIPVFWENAEEISIPATDLEKEPESEGLYVPLPSSANQSKNYQQWDRDFADWLYGTRKLELFFCPSLKEVSKPGETEPEFRIRLGQSAREQRDEIVEQLRRKYATKENTLQERKRRAEQAKEKQAEQAKKAKIDTAISFGSTLLSAFAGRKITSTTISRASTAMKGITRSVDESKDVDRAGETVEAIDMQIKELNARFQADVQALEVKLDPSTEILESVLIKPTKSNIQTQLVALAWVPYWQDVTGGIKPAW